MVDRWRRRAPLAVVLIAYLLLATGYNWVNPLFESPDELLHFDFVVYLRQTGQLPVVDPIAPLSEYHQPPLYYALAALATSGFDLAQGRSDIVANPFWAYDIGQVGRDNKNQYLHPPGEQIATGMALAAHAIRLLSTVIGLAGVYGAYRLMRLLRPGQPALAVAVAAVMGFIPNYLLTTASITNDALVAALPVWLLIWQIKMLRRSQRPAFREVALLGGALGLAALAKVSSYPIAVVAGAMLAMWAWRVRSFSWLVQSGLVLALGFLATSGWWFLRNVTLYGDLTGLGAMWASWGVRASLTVSQIPVELYNLRTTFWSNFGYGNVPAPEPLYHLLDGLTVVAVLGALSAAWRKRRTIDPIGAHAPWALLLIWLALTVGALFWYLTRTQQVTGRQVYAALPAIAVLFVLGWAAWRPGWANGARAGLIALGFALFGAWALFGQLGPAYAPAPKVTSAQADARITHRLDWVIGDIARLRGITLERAVVRPGERLVVTLYWEPLRQTEMPASVFVQLIGEQDRKVGQRDTYPGLGNSPTIFWPVGAVLEDRIEIPVDSDAPSTRVDLLVGLMEFATGLRYPIVDADGATLSAPVAASLVFHGASSAEAPDQQLNVDFEQGLRLTGYTLTSSDSAGPAGLTLFWSPAGPLDSDYTVFVHLQDAQGEPVLQADGPPRGGWYPTTAWQGGELIADAHPLPIEPAPGRYTFLVGLYDPSDGTRLQRVDGGDVVEIPLTWPTP